MREKETTGQQPVILIRNESTRCWEERLIQPPKSSKKLGRTVLTYMKQPRVYEYTDAIATMVLALDHLLR